MRFNNVDDKTEKVIGRCDDIYLEQSERFNIFKNKM